MALISAMSSRELWGAHPKVLLPFTENGRRSFLNNDVVPRQSIGLDASVCPALMIAKSSSVASWVK
jgi:hypothetical protein